MSKNQVSTLVDFVNSHPARRTAAKPSSTTVPILLQITGMAFGTIGVMTVLNAVYVFAIR
ncbi:TPA: hypothetical protein ACGFA2_004495 [Serratia marcescens]|uniref:hypothetical protein n=1 Tax=Serratia marcescens TaxID=615 RepID=UPI0036FD00CE